MYLISSCWCSFLIVWKNFHMEDFPYCFLQEIKDGIAASTKCEINILELKTPNIVLVSLNDLPDKDKISKDRWTVRSIRNICYILTWFRKWIIVDVLWVCILKVWSFLIKISVWSLCWWKILYEKIDFWNSSDILHWYYIY